MDANALEKLYRLYLSSKGVSTDSRTIKPDQIFVTLKGPNFNASDFISTALEKGAFAVITDETSFPDSKINDAEFIIVSDPLKTLQDLAAFHLKENHITVTGLTGSNGKTTTKALIASVISEDNRFACTEGNLNNHIGLPLTVLKKRSETVKHLLLEMGDNRLGDIEQLCHISNPSFAMITNVGVDHLGEFGNMENNIRSKKQLFDYVIAQNGLDSKPKTDSGLIINIDCPVNREYLNKVLPENRLTYGTDPIYTPQVFGKILENLPEGLIVEISLPGQAPMKIKTNLPGKYNLSNLTAAAAWCFTMGIESEKIKTGLEKYKPLSMRSQMMIRSGYRFFMDGYNANPDSMKAAIESMFEWKDEKIVLVLGDMLELGDFSAEFHAEILDFISGFPVVRVVTVGPEFKASASAKKYSYDLRSYETVSETDSEVKTLLSGATLILLKGSRGIKIENFAKNI